MDICKKCNLFKEIYAKGKCRSCCTKEYYQRNKKRIRDYQNNKSKDPIYYEKKLKINKRYWLKHKKKLKKREE